MAIKLKADPSQLKSASSDMAGYARNLQQAYKALMSAVDQAYSAWDGEDATQFYNKAHELDDDFQQMIQLLQGASNDLSESAQKYSATQRSAVGNASKLAGNI